MAEPPIALWDSQIGGHSVIRATPVYLVATLFGRNQASQLSVIQKESPEVGDSETDRIFAAGPSAGRKARALILLGSVRVAAGPTRRLLIVHGHFMPSFPGAAGDGRLLS